MKLTIFYDRQDINFLLKFFPISEEYFIEHSSCAMEQDWTPGKNPDFFEKISCSENVLIVISGKMLESRWIPFILGYIIGKNLNCHIFSLDSELPDWSRLFNVSGTIGELFEYYRIFNGEWFEKEAIKIARKTLVDLYRDITLTSFVEVVKEGDCLLAGIYLEAGFKATDRDRSGVPVICWAARKRKLPMFRLLMQAGADINAVSGDRNDTALIDAVSEDDYEIVSFILNYEPDLEIKSKNGQTALIIASGHNNLEIVELLIEKGADRMTKDKLGMSALSYARLQQRGDILKILKEDI